MKTPKVLTDVEHEAARQLSLVVGAVKKQYQRLVAPSKKKRAHTAERQYLRSVEQTIASAETIIRKLKPRIAKAKRALGGAKKAAKKTATRAKRKVNSARRTAALTKRRKKKL